MKYLGIDYGTKRIGIALSDESGQFAFPKSIVAPDKAIAEIAGICQQESVTAIVIGKSIASNGMDNEIVPIVEKFKEKLAGVTGLPVHFQQESFSTMEAHRYQTKAGSRDDSAAAIILQRYLDTL
ncbi:MAG: Holliday junction resolvase RuvX [Candidatus Paceibacterota bacterium]